MKKILEWLKAWDPKKFVFPYYAPKGGHTFIGALNRMGFKLSLWLCVRYDLFRYEEQCAAGMVRKFGPKPDILESVAVASKLTYGIIRTR